MTDAPTIGSDVRRPDLSSTDLTGGRLEGSVLMFVELANLEGRGARLKEVEVRFADAHGVNFAAAEMGGSRWEHVQLRDADLSGTDLRRAIFRNCSLEGVRLDDADCSDAALMNCSFDGASFRRCNLAGATTVGCSFADAELEAARNFSTCRDIVVEVLRRAVGDDREDLGVVGAIALERSWCWEHWAEKLTPEQRRRGLKIFAKYRDSGCAAALRLPAMHKP